MIQEPLPKHPSILGKALLAVFVCLLFLTVALVIISFPIGLYTVFFTSISTAFNAASVVQGVYIFVGPFVTTLPIPGSMGGYFVGLSVVYGAMFVLAAMQGRGLLSSLKGAFSEGPSSLLANNFYVTVIAIGFLGFVILMIDSVETAGGVPIGSLSGDAMQLFMSLATAPLREELGFRMVIIGIPALLLCAGKPWRTTLKSLWRPSAAYEGETNTTRTQAVLATFAVISAIVFGLAHILYASGWDIGKLPEAAAAGLVLGYLYIRYGFHVAVLAHWGIDYLGSVFAFFGQGAFGIQWTSNTGYILQQVESADAVALFGVASFLFVSYLALRSWLTKRQALSEL